MANHLRSQWSLCKPVTLDSVPSRTFSSTSLSCQILIKEETQRTPLLDLSWASWMLEINRLATLDWKVVLGMYPFDLSLIWKETADLPNHRVNLLFFPLGRITNVEFRLWFVLCSTFVFLTLCKWANNGRRGFIRYSPCYWWDRENRPPPRRHKNVFEWRNIQTILGDLSVTEHRRTPTFHPQWMDEVLPLRRGLCLTAHIHGRSLRTTWPGGGGRLAAVNTMYTCLAVYKGQTDLKQITGSK